MDGKDISVLIADDHALMRAGLKTVINQQPDMEVVAEAGNGCVALDLYARYVPDIALVDLRMPGIGGVELAESIRGRFPGAKVVILTTYDAEDDIERGLRAGAKAFLLKDLSCDELVSAIREVHRGKTVVAPGVAEKLAEQVNQARLTSREMSVLRLVFHGKANKEIASDLCISEGTVKLHLTHLFEKLGVSSRTEAIASAMRRGLVRLD